MENISRSFFPIMDSIKDVFDVKNITFIDREKASYIEKAYEVRTNSRSSCVCP